MPWTKNQRIEWALQSYSDRYRIGWNVPKDGRYDSADDQRSKASQRILGIPESKIGGYPYEQLFGTNDRGDGGWIWHPSLYWTGPNPIQNRLRLKRHNDALAQFRATHTVKPVVLFDGVPMPRWIAEVLQKARDAGVHFRVSSGFRTLAQSWDLYLHPQGYVVAYPGTSHHEGLVFPDGAADIFEGQEQLDSWLRSHPQVARGLTWAGDADRVHFSIPGAHRAGEGSF